MRTCVSFYLWRIAVGLATLAVALTTAVAADAPASRLPAISGPVQVTPDTAAAMAVARATDAALAGQTVLTAEGRLAEARSMAGWQVSVDGVYSRTGPATTLELPESMGGGSISFNPTQTATATLQVVKPLYLGGRDRHAVAAAQAGISAAQSGVAGTQLSLALSARQMVFGLLRLSQLAGVAQQRLTATAEHLRLAESMFAAGTAPKFEVVQAQTQVAAARGDVIRARTAVAQQQAALCQLLNLPQGTELVAEEGVPAARPSGDLQALVALAWEQRPDLQAAHAAVAAAAAGLRLARAGDRASVAVATQVNAQTKTVASSDLNWRASLQVSKPIFQGGATEAKVKQAEAAVQSANLNVEKAEQQIALQITQATLAIDQATESLAVAEEGAREARERLRIAQVRFASGVGLGVEVLDAQTVLAAAEATVVNSRYDLYNAIVGLRAAMGMLDLTKE